MAQHGTPTMGPIARKVVAELRKHKRRHVVDVAQWREAEEIAKEVLDGASPPPGGEDLPPAFALYSFVTNFAVGLVEILQELPQLRRFIDRIEEAEDEYMPSGPPMSPLTRSFFWHGMLWDTTVGVQRETLGSILLAIARTLEMDSGFVSVLEKLSASRLGLHVLEPRAEDRIVLRELVTDERKPSISPAGYDGSPGQLWLARVVPPPAPHLPSVVITTPYVILAPGVSGWDAYLDRTLPRIAAKNRLDAYRLLMKHGLEPMYWSEYVLAAYVNHVPEAIFLTGLPDVAESRPHSRADAFSG